MCMTDGAGSWNQIYHIVSHMIHVQNISCDQNPKQTKTHKNSHMYNVTKSHDSDTTIQYKVVHMLLILPVHFYNTM